MRVQLTGALALSILSAACAGSDGEQQASKRSPVTEEGDSSSDSRSRSRGDDDAKGWSDEEDEAEDEPRKDHTRGQTEIDEDEAPNESGRVLLQTVLTLAPLAEGHMMSDIMNSPRAFRPQAGVGAWAASSFAWKDQTSYPRFTNQGTASFAFTAPEGVATECRLDNGAWTACSGGYQATALTDGYHELAVRAAGGKATLGTYRWKVDTKPALVFAVRDPQLDTVLVKANEELFDVKCSLGAQVVDCKAGFPAAGATGALSVEAKDLAGNVTTQTLSL